MHTERPPTIVAYFNREESKRNKSKRLLWYFCLDVYLCATTANEHQLVLCVRKAVEGTATAK